MSIVPDQPDGAGDDARPSFHMLYGPGRGAAHLAYGSAPYRNDNDKIIHRTRTTRTAMGGAR